MRRKGRDWFACDVLARSLDARQLVRRPGLGQDSWAEGCFPAGMLRGHAIRNQWAVSRRGVDWDAQSSERD